MSWGGAKRRCWNVFVTASDAAASYESVSRPRRKRSSLERKNELDQVVYSLLRLENSFLARELYLQIEAGESNFADLAKRYAEGPERNTNGIVGPVSLTQAHPILVEKLRVAQPGVLLEPFPHLGLVVGCAVGALLAGHLYRRGFRSDVRGNV